MYLLPLHPQFLLCFFRNLSVFLGYFRIFQDTQRHICGTQGIFLIQSKTQNPFLILPYDSVFCFTGKRERGILPNIIVLSLYIYFIWYFYGESHASVVEIVCPDIRNFR